MKLKITVDHKGEGAFPLFKQGSKIHLGKECDRYPNWFSCEIAGYTTYVPRHFVAQGKLLCDYNPTELAVKKDEIVNLIELCYGWAIVERDKDVGWLPCDILISNI
ncbi:hypothetical protein QMO40_03565 [Mannheimia bovis]|uniref:SH3 domain-containing protein n=1 Tax=Mannheimia bovis TaxID=2770636 RepID=A0A7H1C474_9PAST|nr:MULTISPECIES: hypothetical protein [Mannheimia]AHG74294.1 hypothetical protein X781_21490 [Mannheimia sp. USDA-ARS-USMARC-1261]QNS15779.1 hypothetical protein ICJ55_03270 [Mannheimia bovis]WHP47749.1 hypothetical protein QMO40_03565 [Mannheimia bovis]